MCFVFKALMQILFKLSHMYTFRILHWSILLLVENLLQDFITVENVLSSANNMLKKIVQLGKSLTNIRKTRGPNIDPWEVPKFTGNVYELVPWIPTQRFQLLNKILTSKRNASQPTMISLESDIWWHTQSKAFLKYKNSEKIAWP